MLYRLRRSWAARVAVTGDSMRPTLEPGDWLLVDPDAYAHAPPAPGALVLVPDPRQPMRLLVKRVDQVGGAGDELLVVGDAPDESTDSRAFGSVPTDGVAGRPWYRYWPLSRIGRIS